MCFVLAEVFAGIFYNSIALLTDAGHNASDVASLLLSLVAFRLARRKPNQTYTYGYKKATVLAALANAVILLVAVGVLGYESVKRLYNPTPVTGGIIAWVAGAGIIINSLSAYLFSKNKEQDLNVKSAYLHLLADALVSVGVVIGGIVISYTDLYWIDPVIGLIVMVVILVSTWSLLRDSFRMAVDAVPIGVSIEEVINVMKGVSNVIDINHVHIWALSTTENALTAHVMVDEQLNFEEKLKVVQQIKHKLTHHNIHHSTIELEIKLRTEECNIKEQ
jgi:cobalt-zinc-cadmium efflux system protein